jgi:hypothetical protein
LIDVSTCTLQPAFLDALRTAPTNGFSHFPELLKERGERSARRLDVYRNNIRAFRMRAIENAFPVVRQITGDEFFAGLAREYAQRFDSADGDLNLYGEGFSGFVAGFEHTQDLPYLADVARMEWLAHRAYFARDCAPLDLARLGQVPPAQQAALRFELNPAAAILQSAYPLARIWEVHQNAFTGTQKVEFSNGPHYALVYRAGFDVAVGALGPGEYAFLQALLSGTTLEIALSQALTMSSEFDIGAALRDAVARAVIVALKD